MKKKLIYISLFLLFGVFFSCFANEKADNQHNEKDFVVPDSVTFGFGVVDTFVSRGITFFSYDVSYSGLDQYAHMNFDFPVECEKKDVAVLENLQTEVWNLLFDGSERTSDLRRSVYNYWADWEGNDNFWYEIESSVKSKKIGWSISVYSDWIVTNHSISSRTVLCDLETGRLLNLTVDNFIKDDEELRVELKQLLFDKVSMMLKDEEGIYAEFVSNEYDPHEFIISDKFSMDDDGVYFMYNLWYDLGVSNRLDLRSVHFTFKEIEKFVQEEWLYLIKLGKEAQKGI